jgi:hypothetical protein
LDSTGLTGVFDINWLIGGSWFDGSWVSVEVPFLACSSVLSLKN